jgi:ketosteroid isomerase-like protein
MKKSILFLLVAVMFSCKHPGADNSPFNLSDVKKIINDNNKLYRIAFLSGDSAAFVYLHHSQTINMPPDQPLMKGKGPMGAMIKDIPKMGVTDYSVKTTAVYGGPEDVVEEGTYQVYTGAKTLEKGKYIVIWKPEGGKWKIYRSIWNRDSK